MPEISHKVFHRRARCRTAQPAIQPMVVDALKKSLIINGLEKSGLVFPQARRRSRVLRECGGIRVIPSRRMLNAAARLPVGRSIGWRGEPARGDPSTGFAPRLFPSYPPNDPEESSVSPPPIRPGSQPCAGRRRRAMKSAPMPHDQPDRPSAPAADSRLALGGAGGDARARRGVPFEAMPAPVDEAAVKAAMLAEGAPPRDIADALAELKARRAAPPRAGALVVGADQVLSCDGRLFDKPRDRAEARDQLAALRGRTHELHAAAVVYEDARPVWRHVGRAQLTMRPFSDAFLDGYLAARGRGALRDRRRLPDRGRRRPALRAGRGRPLHHHGPAAARAARLPAQPRRGAGMTTRRRRSPACSAGRSGTRARRGCTATGSRATGSRATTSRSRCRPRPSRAASRACRRSASAASTSRSRTRRRRWRSPPRRPTAPARSAPPTP